MFVRVIELFSIRWWLFIGCFFDVCCVLKYFVRCVRLCGLGVKICVRLWLVILVSVLVFVVLLLCLVVCISGC